MFGWRVSTLSTIGFLILLGLGSIAVFKVGRHGNIVGDVRTVGVVLDPKWKRVALNMKLQGSLIDSGAYQCTLQVCEHDAIAGVGLRRAAGLFKSPNADSADQDGLTRDMAFEILVETMPQFRKAFDETLTRIKIGPLTGYRTVVSPDLKSTQLPVMAMDLLQAGDQLIIVSVAMKDGGAEEAESLLPEIENGIRLKGQPIAR